jgi:hypothetical protein
MRILSTVACALGCVALLAATGQAAPRRHSSTLHRAGKVHARAALNTRLAAKPAAPVAGGAGMVVAVDPETGALRMPTAEEMQTLQSMNRDDALNLSNQGLSAEPLTGGGIKIDLQGRFQDYSVVRVGPDGKFIFGCGKTQAEAMAETYAPSRPTGAPEVK